MAPLARAPAAVPLCALALSVLPLPATADPAHAASAGPKPPYTTTHSRYRKHANFVVTYKGLGTWRTVFHATPPNPGGGPDTNDAHDSSGQAWRLLFSPAITVEQCGPRKDRPDRCSSLGDLNDATGATIATGQVDHRHVDGLYRQLDKAVSCRVRAETDAGQQLPARIGIRYSAKQITVTTYNPLYTVLILLPSQCQSDPDGIDRMAGNYFGPGFSFTDGWGPDRWFTSREVTIPTKVFHHSSEVTVRLGDTAAGTPPVDCTVPNPSYERCSTGGKWVGILTFKAP